MGPLGHARNERGLRVLPRLCWLERLELVAAQSGGQSFSDLCCAAVATHDLKNVQSLSAGLISEYSSTLYAPLAAFASAQSASDAGDLADAKAKLNWVIEKSGRPEYDTVARVRLAGVLFDEGKLDEAAAVLAAAKPAEAQKVLVLDRQGDIWAAKGDLQKARDAWTQAQAALNPQDPLNRVLELKLAALPSAS